MAKITWSKAQREVADAGELCLIALAVDGRPAHRFGKLEFTKPVKWEDAQKVIALIEELTAKKG